MTVMGFSNGGDTNRKKFTGYQRDSETGLDYAQARYYGNTQGRFTSPDPFSGSATIANPQTFNRYVYCGNNPVNSTDPSGLAARGLLFNIHGGKYSLIFSLGSKSHAAVNDDIDEAERKYVQGMNDTVEAAREARYLTAAIESGALTADEAASIAAYNPLLAVVEKNPVLNPVKSDPIQPCSILVEPLGVGVSETNAGPVVGMGLT